MSWWLVLISLVVMAVLLVIFLVGLQQGWEHGLVALFMIIVFIGAVFVCSVWYSVLGAIVHLLVR